jgi:hypothetical protein
MVDGDDMEAVYRYGVWVPKGGEVYLIWLVCVSICRQKYDWAQQTEIHLDITLPLFAET